MLRILLVMISVVGAARAQKPESVESVVFKDLMENSTEVVNVKHSNSANCKASCTVKKYLSLHLDSATKEFEEIKKTPRKKYVEVFGTSVEEDTVAEPNFKGHCAENQKYPFEEELKSIKVKLPPNGKTILCSLQFGLKFGERTWSEQLFYMKNKDTGLVVAGTFKAVGTP